MAQITRPKRHRARNLNTTPGYEFGMGPKVTDAVNGDPIPKRLAVKQRGGWVSVFWPDGSRDKPDSYDG